jgi:hypothetical protein
MLETAGTVMHGARRKGADRKTYYSWQGMIQRCTNPANPKYPQYGGRGILVCDRWREYSNFLADMGPRPSNSHSIERRDTNGNYEPTNCVWATATVQGRNRRSVKLTLDVAERIRSLVASGVSVSSVETVYDIVSGKTWRAA